MVKLRFSARELKKETYISALSLSLMAPQPSSTKWEKEEGGSGDNDGAKVSTSAGFISAIPGKNFQTDDISGETFSPSGYTKKCRVCS